MSDDEIKIDTEEPNGAAPSTPPKPVAAAPAPASSPPPATPPAVPAVGDDELLKKIKELENKLNTTLTANRELMTTVGALAGRIELLEKQKPLKKAGTLTRTPQKSPSREDVAADDRAKSASSADGRRTLPRNFTRPATASTPSASEKKEKDEVNQTPPKRTVSKLLGARTLDGKEDSGAMDGARKAEYNVGARKITVAFPKEHKVEKAAEPDTELVLEHVYGYNGKLSRDNLFFSKENKGELVYNCAGVGVVWNPTTNTQRFFIEHDEDILSLAVHPTRPIVATGQRDPKGQETPYICIWDEESCTLKRKIKYHDRGIIALAFSPDGTYLASIGEDDGHTMAIWEWEEKAGKAGKEKDTPLCDSMVSKDEVYALAFNPFSNVSEDGKDGDKPKDFNGVYELVTVGKKHIKVWATEGINSKDKAKRKLLSRIPSTFDKTKVVQKGYHCIGFLPNGDFVTGTSDGCLYLFKGKDLKTFVKAHKGVCAAVTVTKDQIISVGDQAVKLWSFDLKEKGEIELKTVSEDFKPRAIDHQDGTIVIGGKDNSLTLLTLDSKEEKCLLQSHSNDAWAVAVHPTLPILATGGHDNSLRIWDYKERTFMPGRTLNLKSPVRAAMFSNDGNYLALGLNNGKVVVMDVKKEEQVWSKSIAKETIDSIDISSDGSVLAVGSWDQCIYVIALPTGTVLHTLKGHTSSILMLNFSADGLQLMSNSRDYEILYWDVKKGKRLTYLADVVETKWARWNCFLGWPVQGIWADCNDGTDINAVDRSPDEKVLAAGDDFGMVRLYKYPVDTEKAPYKKYLGHCSHVPCVRFSPNSDYLFSSGGHDMAIMQWKHQKAMPKE